MGIRPPMNAQRRERVGPQALFLFPEDMASDSLMHLAQEHHIGSCPGQGGGASDAGCVAHAQGHGLAHALPVTLFLLPGGRAFKNHLVPCGGHTSMS